MSNQEEAQPAQEVQLDASPRAGEVFTQCVFCVSEGNINHSNRSELKSVETCRTMDSHLICFVFTELKKKQ